MTDICIIGGGPAGISSAVYSASRGLKTVVFEKKSVGGILGDVSTVTHYSGIVEGETGASFAERLRRQALEAGVEIRMEEVQSVSLSGDIKKITTEQDTYEAKAVIIAAGTTPRKLGIPGETELAGRGVGMNAAMTAEVYKGKEMFVVGGADGAVKEALYLSKYASNLTIIHFEDQLGAIPEFTEKVKNTDNIEVLLHTRLKAVEGDKKVDALIIEDEHTKEVRTIQSEGCAVYIYAGSEPNSQLFSEIETEDGYFVTNRKQETNLKGVYAAGDICVKQVRQAATAVSDGAVAAINAAAYVKTL